jgi:hypothetical protein
LPHSSDSDATRATASLPGLEIEIVHRRPQGDNLEALSINLQAKPSFEAFGRFLETANPFVFWAQAMEQPCSKPCSKPYRWHGCLGSEQVAR